MADDLNRIEQELTKVEAAAKRATAEIERLQQQLAQVIRTQATGGVPTEARSMQVAGSMLSGEEVPGRTRVGGGSRVTINKVLKEVDYEKLLDDYLKQLFRTKYEQMRKELLIQQGGQPLQERFALQKEFGTREDVTSSISGLSQMSRTFNEEEQRNLLLSMETRLGGSEKDVETVDRQKELDYLNQIKDALREKEELQNVELKKVREIQEAYERLNQAIQKGVEDKKDPAQVMYEFDESEKARSERDTTSALKEQEQALDSVTAKWRNRQQEAIGEQKVRMESLATENKLLQEQGILIKQMGAERAQAAQKFAGERGFGFEHLKQKEVYTQEPLGLTFLQYEKIDQATGAVSKLDFAVDKMGNTLFSTNKRLLGFFDAVVRNTKEILRWSMGVMLVYGSIYKLTDMVKIAIENQTKLADIMVILGERGRTIQQIFDDAAVVAKATGEDITGVLETYAYAYRAVGSIEDPIKRTAAANKLLYDATVLNKLSTLDQSSAIDVLSGSLRQIQKPAETTTEAFQRGTEVLDQWVAVSRRANVDLATLSTAFSITAESALNSGTSVEQLNAIIAVLSEKIGGLGGRETGMAVRAIIGGIYRESSVDILTRYGIAVSDTTGRMRPFLDISAEIYTLYREGIIDADELNRVAFVLGNGVRRGQQYVAFLSDLARIQEIVDVQTTSHGQSQEALSLKMDTVQTSITRMANSFESLAMTIGDSGGVLDVLGGVLNVVTLLLDSFEKLSRVLGTLTIPATLVALGAMMFRGPVGAMRFAGIQTGIGALVGGTTAGLLGKLPGLGQPSWQDQRMAMAMGTTALSPAQRAGGFMGGAASKYALPLLMGSFPAMTRFSQGETKEGAWNLAGAALGTALGSVLAGPVGMYAGSMIGGAIAETFISQTLQYKSQFHDLFQPIWEEASKSLEDIELPEYIGQQEEIMSEIFKQASGGMSEFAGTLFSRIMAGIAEASMNTAAFFGDVEKPLGVTPEQTALWLMGGERREQLLPEIERVRTETPIDVTEDILKRSQIYQDQIDLTKEYKDALDDIIKTEREKARTELFAGDIKSREYLDIMERIAGLKATVPAFYTIFGEELEKSSKIINNMEDSFESFSTVLSRASKEEIVILNQLVGEAFDLAAGLEEIEKQGVKTFLFHGQILDSAEAAELLNDKIEVLVNSFQVLNEEQLLRGLKLPTVVGLGGLEGYDTGDYEKILDKAFKLQDDKFKAQMREGFFDEDVKNTMIAKADPIFAYLGERIGYHLVKGLTDSNFLSTAEKMLLDAGEILASEALGFQVFGTTSAQFQQALTQYPRVLGMLEGLGYKEDPKKLIPIFEDGIAKPLSKDWKIIELILREIADNTKQTVDGIYNLPSDMSFFVPFAGYQQGTFNLGGAGGGGLGDLQLLEDFLGDKVEEPTKSEIYPIRDENILKRILEREERFDAMDRPPTVIEPPKIEEIIPSTEVHALPEFEEIEEDRRGFRHFLNPLTEAVGAILNPFFGFFEEFDSFMNRLFPGSFPETTEIEPTGREEPRPEALSVDNLDRFGGIPFTGGAAFIALASTLFGLNGEFITGVEQLFDTFFRNRLEVETPDLDAVEVEPIIVDVPEIQPVSFSQMDEPTVVFPEIEPPVLDPLKIEDMELETLEFRLPEIEPLQVEKPEFVPLQVEKPDFIPIQIEIPRFDPLKVDDIQLDPLSVATPIFDPLKVEEKEIKFSPEKIQEDLIAQPDFLNVLGDKLKDLGNYFQVDFWKDINKNLESPAMDTFLPDIGSETVMSSLRDLANKMEQYQGVSTQLTLSLESSVQLVVDGRTLAAVVKPYLYEDMLRFESHAGSVTKRFVI